MEITIKYILSLLILINLNCFALFAQTTGNNTLDSLLVELENAEQDTLKIKLLSEISFFYGGINPKKGLEFGIKGLELSKENNFKSYLGGLYSGIGTNYFSLSEYKKSLEYFRKSLKVAKENGNKAAIGVIKANIGVTFYKMSNFLKAIENYNEAIKIYEDLKDYTRIYDVSINLGLIYIKFEQFQKALKHYKSLLKYVKEIDDPNYLGRTKSSISRVFQNLGKLDSAFKYDFDALEIYISTGNKTLEATALGNIGNIYFLDNNYDEALEYYKRALKIDSSLNVKESVARHYGNIGDLHYNLTIDSIKKKVRRKGTDLRLNDFYNLNKAEYFLEKSLALYEKVGEIKDRSTMYEYLSKVYAKKNEFENAYEMLLKHNSLKDSIKDTETRRELAKIEMKRNKKLKEKEIELLKTENEYRQNLITFFVILALLILAIVFIIFYLYSNKKKQNQLLEEKIDERTSELVKTKKELEKALDLEREYSKMKTNFILGVSHEFRTPLTAISSSAMILEILGKNTSGIDKQAKKIIKSVKTLNSTLEQILEYSKSESQLINPNFEELDPISICKENLEIIKGKDKADHQISFENKAEIKKIKSDRSLINGALRHILENSLIFTPEGKSINLILESDNKYIYFKIIDEGIGISAQSLEFVFEPFFKGKENIGVRGGTGLGLSTAKNYVEMLNGEILIESELDQGTKVIVKIPISQ